MESRDLVIVGGGPAGTGTALALERLEPSLARRALILDAAEFPRDKTCAGGLIPHTLELLRALDLELTVPAVRVDRAEVEAGGERIEIESEGCCFVIRRREFDDMLLSAARTRGIEVQTGVKVRAAERRGDRIVLRTSHGDIETRAVVGADGSGSVIRRSLVDPEEGWVARALMCDVPIDSAQPPATYEFDFREVASGLRGYAWSFPCLIDGRPHWNLGVYSIQRRGEGERLERALQARGGRAGLARRAHPIRIQDFRRPLGAPGVLLAGDAAGVDALLGEGISFALEYGRLAAEALADGFQRDDLGFAQYESTVRRSPTGKKLRRLRLGAKLFYGPWGGFWFWVARQSPRAQRIGMNWYNGVGYWSPRVPPLRRAAHG